MIPFVNQTATGTEIHPMMSKILFHYLKKLVESADGYRRMKENEGHELLITESMSIYMNIQNELLIS